MGVYLTAAELKADPAVPDNLPDPEAEALIADAEDRVDQLLGAWAVQDNGRKVVQAAVAAWQWAKVKRATLKLAVRAYTDPNAFQESRYTSVSGPDFSASGAEGTSGAAAAADAVSLLNASGLRRLTARARP